MVTHRAFTADILMPVNKAKAVAEFTVVEGDGRSLLGKATAEELVLLRVGPKTGAYTVSESDAHITEKFPKLFSGVGKLKGRELKLHIDDSVQTVDQPFRRIPFALREKIDKKITKLIDLDIIELLPETPTTWVSPLVVIPKKDGDVQVCVDMRQANQAIRRERYPVPSTDELAK